MKIDANTPRNERQIGGKRAADAKFAPGTEFSFTLQVPAPITIETQLTEGMVAVLNQTLAENISNNLRAKLGAGITEGEGDAATTREYTPEEAQALIDSYVDEYEFGVRRTGSGEPRVTDPVEKEARAIAREKAKQLVVSKGLKVGDVDMPTLTENIFSANREFLMKEAKKIVDARNRTQGKDDAFSFDGIDLAPKAKAAPETAEAA